MTAIQSIVTLARRGAWVVAVVVATLAPSATGYAFCRMSAQNPTACCNPDQLDCVYVRWTRRCVGVGIEEGGSRTMPFGTVQTAVDRAFGSWTDLACASFRSTFQVRRFIDPIQCDRAEYNATAGNVNAVGFVSDWLARDLDPRAYAITVVWNDVVTGTINDADIALNEEQYTFANCPDIEGCFTGEIDLQAVLTREAGHFFGLGVSEVAGVTMSATMRPGDVTARTLERDDADGFCAIYPTSPSGQCDFVPEGGLSAECGGSLGCGCQGTSPRSMPADVGMALVAAFLLDRRRRRRKHAARPTS